MDSEHNTSLKVVVNNFEDNRVYVKTKNPIDGSDITVIITRTDEGIVVGLWSYLDQFSLEPTATVYESWSNMTEEQKGVG